VVDDADLGPATRALAEQIAAAPPVTVRMIKRATYQSANADLRTSLDLISSHFAVVAATDDAAEALSAMREKRVPSFHGR
jgi:enoyl-CoA hydratase/carnithine racemase